MSLRNSELLILSPLLSLKAKFPNYGKIDLTLASTYIELGELNKSVESYQNFIKAYKQGDFTFKSIVGGIEQQVKGKSEIETIILTSINHLNKSFQNECLNAFNKALEIEFWFSYAENNRTYVIEQKYFQSCAKLIDISKTELNISENVPTEIKEKILFNWSQEKIISSEGVFWLKYSQGGKQATDFKSTEKYVNYDSEVLKTPSWLPDKNRQEANVYWRKEKLDTFEGYFWQKYSQGGYELIKDEEVIEEYYRGMYSDGIWASFEEYLKVVEFKENYLKFLNITIYGDFVVPNWLPNDLKEKIEVHQQKERQQFEERVKSSEKKSSLYFVFFVIFTILLLAFIGITSFFNSDNETNYAEPSEENFYSP